ncbi:MAG: PIN domain-containing protein [Verrucomicrobia bacterium]|jgi:predicted nucleic acid-binding protein|nr:PIN domain-containing protein [Verrucomicrobiota bacterium]
MNYADTNWLEALYFAPEDSDLVATQRKGIVELFCRSHGGRLGVSIPVTWEARNVFSRASGESAPEEWNQFEADKDGLIYVDPVNWDLLKRDMFRLFSLYSHKASIGTLDAAILAASKLGGATRLLTFDDTLAAMAVCEGLVVFPELSAKGKAVLAKLKTPAPAASRRSSGSN